MLMQSYMLETVQYISVVGQTCQMGCLSFRMRSRGQIVFSSNDFQVSSMFLSDLNVLLLSTAVLLLSTAVLLLSTAVLLLSTAVLLLSTIFQYFSSFCSLEDWFMSYCRANQE